MNSCRSYLFDYLYSKTSSCNCRDESQCCQDCSILIIKWIAECLCCSISYSSSGIPSRLKSSSVIIIIQVQSTVSENEKIKRRFMVRGSLLLLKLIWALRHVVKYLRARSLSYLKFSIKDFRKKSVYCFLWIFHNIFSRYDWSDLWVIYFMLMIFV